MRLPRLSAMLTPLLLLPALAVAQVPPLPAVPTTDSCRAYMLDNHARRAAIHQAVSACLRSFAWNFSDRYTHPVCKHPPPRIENETSAFDCPTQADALCALVAAERDIKACFVQARATQQGAERAQQKLADFNRLERTLAALRHAKNDPRRLFWSVIEPRLPTDVRLQLDSAMRHANGRLAKGSIPMQLARSGDSLFTASMFQRNGDFTQRGSSLLQETYDFIHARTLGDRSPMPAREGNPIIRAIQGTAAGEIDRVFSATIARIDGDIAGGMAAVAAAAPPATATATGWPAPPARDAPRAAVPVPVPAATDCAALDGPGRTDLAVDAPDAFEQLLRRCRHEATTPSRP